MTIAPTDIALSIKDLTVAFDKKPVLWDVDLDIPKGAMLLANNNQKVYCNQVVAEIKKEVASSAKAMPVLVPLRISSSPLSSTETLEFDALLMMLKLFIPRPT